jgi:hypothetical protein
MRQILYLTMLCLFLAATAHASTASKVFQTASRSTVMVSALNAAGKSFAYGTGVVLPDGSIATNCHVLKRAPRLSVLYQGKDYVAERKFADRDRDLCTITVNGLNAPAVKMGSTRRLKVGARVYAIGTPQGLELTLSEGIVSGFREDEVGRYIQTTAPISQGSSGGGLFDEKGRLVGITSFNIAKGQNLNFALPVEWIAELPQRHALFGKVWTEVFTGMEFVWVTGGCLCVSSPLGEGGRKMAAQHQVCVDGFWLGRHEVTVGQYRRSNLQAGAHQKHSIVERWEQDEQYNSLPYEKKSIALGRLFDDTFSKDEKFGTLSPENQNIVRQRFFDTNLPDDHPRMQVSTNDAVEYARWLSGITGLSFRLPTEDELQYARHSMNDLDFRDGSTGFRLVKDH